MVIYKHKLTGEIMESNCIDSQYWGAYDCISANFEIKKEAPKMYIIPGGDYDDPAQYFTEFDAAFKQVQNEFRHPCYIIKNGSPLKEAVIESGVVKEGPTVDLSNYIDKVEVDKSLIESEKIKLESIFEARKEKYQQRLENPPKHPTFITGCFPGVSFGPPTYYDWVEKPLDKYINKNSYQWKTP